MLGQLLTGLSAAVGSGSAIAFLVGGVLLGVFVGVIPGLSGAVVLSIALVFVYKINLQATLVLFLAVSAASFFSASVGSILLNTPAHPEAFPATLDGFPMARKGQASRALGISALSTALGGLLGCVALVGIFQVVTPLTTAFHPPEYVAVIVLAMFLVSTQGRIPTSKSLASVGVGLLISSIGTSAITGTTRFDFGSPYLLSGIPLGVFAIGVFAIPQMILLFGRARNVVSEDLEGRAVDDSAPSEISGDVRGQILTGFRDVRTHWLVLLQGAIVGIITGIIPGIGGFAANYLSYSTAKQLSKRRESFGTGVPEGLIAPEASSISKEAGGLVPTLGLGIPHGTASALFLAALAIQDKQVGIGFIGQNFALSYEMVWIIAIAGVLGSIVGIALVPLLSQVTKVPGPCLFPIIIALCVTGVYVTEVAMFYLWELCALAVAGLMLRRLGYSLASLLMGLVLGPTLESNIYLTHTVYPGISFLWRRPGADVILLLAITVLIFHVLQLRRAARAARRDKAGPAEKQGAARPYPLLEAIVSSVIAVVSVAAVVYSFTRFDFAAGILPEAAGSLAGVAALWRVAVDIPACVRYFREKDGAGTPPPDEEIPGGGNPVGEGPVEEGPVDWQPPVGAGTSRGLVREVSVAPRETVAAAVRAQARVGGWLRERQLPPPIADRAWGRDGQYTRELLAFGWLVTAVLLSYLLGFAVGMLCLCLLYGLISVRRVFPTWRPRIVFAAAGALVLYFAISGLFQVLNIVEPTQLW